MKPRKGNRARHSVRTVSYRLWPTQGLVHRTTHTYTIFITYYTCTMNNYFHSYDTCCTISCKRFDHLHEINQPMICTIRKQAIISDYKLMHERIAHPNILLLYLLLVLRPSIAACLDRPRRPPQKDSAVLGSAFGQHERRQRLNAKSMEGCYITTWPKETIRALAGFNAKGGNFYRKARRSLSVC